LSAPSGCTAACACHFRIAGLEYETLTTRLRL
jgi:hypothetical protein